MNCMPRRLFIELLEKVIKIETSWNLYHLKDEFSLFRLEGTYRDANIVFYSSEDPASWRKCEN